MHLSQNQRFAEAQKWFHYVFDPTSTDTDRPGTRQRFWKFLYFRQHPEQLDLSAAAHLLSTPDSELDQHDEPAEKQDC